MKKRKTKTFATASNGNAQCTMHKHEKCGKFEHEIQMELQANGKLRDAIYLHHFHRFMDGYHCFIAHCLNLSTFHLEKYS